MSQVFIIRPYNRVNRAPSPYTHCDACGRSLDESPSLVANADGWFCGESCYWNSLNMAHEHNMLASAFWCCFATLTVAIAVILWAVR